MHRIGSLMLAALLVAGGAQAQDNYPTQTVKFVLPSAPGSTTDILTRLTADGLSRKWGKPTVVENIAGGSMNIGAGQVARAAPDGYTLFVAPPAPLALAHLVNKINYNPLDWVPITLLAKIANVLSVRNTLPVNTLQELIAYGKANPGKLTYATQGANSTAHLTRRYLEAQTGIKMLAVAYRGAQPALTDILAGNVDMFFDTLATSVPLHRGGKLKILAVADLQRAKAAPELPTFTEAGVPGFRSITWFGLVAPPGTPAALAQRINRDAVEMLRSPEVAQRLQSLSLEAGATSPRRNREVLCRRDRALGQGDQGSRHRAAIGIPCCIPSSPRGSFSPLSSRCSRPLARNRAGRQVSVPRRHLVVPFPPGGSADALPRIVAEKLRERWGQPVIIENRPGAAGSTGSGSVFRAPPDGYHPARHARRPAGDQRPRSEDAALRAVGVRSRSRCWRCRRPC